MCNIHSVADRLRPATAFERRINLITAAVPRWAACDPFTFDVGALDEDVQEVVGRRLRGSDGLSKLVPSPTSILLVTDKA